METSLESMKIIPSIKLEQDDFIITSDNRRDMVAPDSPEFKPDISHSMSGHEIPLPNIFASPVKNAPIPPAVESPLTPRTKPSINEEYPLPSVNSPIKQEPLLSEFPCSPGSPTASSTFSMPSLTPSPAKKNSVSSLRMKAMITDHQKKVDQKHHMINCICGYEYNDGFIVQCSKCRIWQHIDCFYTNASSKPVAHRCHICVPRYVDFENAKYIQQSKMLARSRLSSLVFDSNICPKVENNINVAPANNTAPSRSSKRKQSLHARSTPDPRLMHTPDIIDMSEFEATGSRTRRYKTAEKNRYTEDLYKHLLRFHSNSVEQLKRNLALELSTKDCETVVTPQREIILVSSAVLTLYDTVIEYRGELMLKEEYLENHDPTSEHSPYVLFYSGLNSVTVVVDATKYGNEARYIRRSCKPNCEIKHTFGENNRLHLIIWATQKVVVGKELTIPFDFDYKECKYSVTCPCNRKNCDVRRWNQAVAFKTRSLSNMDPELKKELEEIPSKRLKQSVKSEKMPLPRQIKSEESDIKTEVKDVHSADSASEKLSKLKGFSFNSSMKPKDEPSASKNLASKSASSFVKSSFNSGLLTSVTRLKSDAEARASLTARLQERLSPGKPSSHGMSSKSNSPAKFLRSPSKSAFGEQGRPSSPSVQMSPNKLMQLQHQSNRRNRRKQQFVALLNPFTDDDNRSSDEEPESLTVWGLDGIRQPR